MRSELEALETGIPGITIKKTKWAKLRIPKTILKRVVSLGRQFFPLEKRRQQLEKEVKQIKKETERIREEIESIATRYLGWRGVISTPDGLDLTFTPTRVSLKRPQILEKISHERYYSLVQEQLKLLISLPVFSREKLITAEEVIRVIKIALSNLGIPQESFIIEIEPQEIDMKRIIEAGLGEFIEEKNWRIYCRSL